MRVNFRSLDLSASRKHLTWGLERPTEGLQMTHKRFSVMAWCAVSKNEVIRIYSFEDENVTAEAYKRLLPCDAFSKLREYSEETIFSRMVFLCTSPFLCLSILTNVTQLFDGGSSLHFVSSLLTWFDSWWLRFWEYLKDTVYHEPPTAISELNTKTTLWSCKYWLRIFEKSLQITENRLSFALREMWPFRIFSKLNKTYFYFEKYALLRPRNDLKAINV